ncbi:MULTISPECIES: VOC family protein [unclassified Sphingomonas]|uniref:VOC family protein n=1 Tax=unclassified Sphingomonas TaxID=196159 RepID=UPI000BDC536E|nr:MAG: glyoxalase/bleomycin resistance/extradiol dioxygenase family protein [Sphingomonas sp. 32-62-10]OYY65606.1 MAG: glyoxalase/bleomycin resistance/extradiol dioxygenase family protein [Sphingomonas sp. 28-62-11]
MKARFSYLELPVGDVAASKAFYAAAFGWIFTDFGPDYAATTTGDTDLGLDGDVAQSTAQLLPVIEVDDLEAALAAVIAAGGVVTMPIFAFPGGRRFHFRDLAGHELAAMTPDAAVSSEA